MDCFVRLHLHIQKANHICNNFILLNGFDEPCYWSTAVQYGTMFSESGAWSLIYTALYNGVVCWKSKSTSSQHIANVTHSGPWVIDYWSLFPNPKKKGNLNIKSTYMQTTMNTFSHTRRWGGLKINLEVCFLCCPYSTRLCLLGTLYCDWLGTWTRLWYVMFNLLWKLFVAFTNN